MWSSLLCRNKGPLLLCRGATTSTVPASLRLINPSTANPTDTTRILAKEEPSCCDRFEEGRALKPRCSTHNLEARGGLPIHTYIYMPDRRTGYDITSCA